MAYGESGLSAKELREWISLKAKGKRHNVSVRRVGPANVLFGGRGFGKVYAQLGTGRATEIMDARVKVKKRR